MEVAGLATAARRSRPAGRTFRFTVPAAAQAVRYELPVAEEPRMPLSYSTYTGRNAKNCTLQPSRLICLGEVSG
jgi:hypothetical protein